MSFASRSTVDSQSRLPPDNLAKSIWQELARATKDRHHDWRTPVLGTVGLDGNPQVRTIVLRQADPTLWTLQAYTDSRSLKCRELVKCNRAQLVFWSTRRRWQLRVSVVASIHHDGEIVETAWAAMRQSKASKDYLSHQAPGSIIETNHGDETGSLNALNNHYLAVLSFQVTSMDWLALGKDYHHRARIDPDGMVTPLIP